MAQNRPHVLWLIGIGSGLAMASAIFAPAVTIAFVGTATMFADMPVLASFIAVTGLFAAFCAWQANGRRQLVCGLFALLLAGLAFYRTLVAIGLARDGLEARVRQIAESGGMSQSGLPIDSMMTGTQLEWGWYLLLGSILVCIVSALVSIRTKPA